MRYSLALGWENTTYFKFYYQLGQKTWAIIHLNTTQQTFTSMSGHIMCILTSPLLSSPGP